MYKAMQNSFPFFPFLHTNLISPKKTTPLIKNIRHDVKNFSHKIQILKTHIYTFISIILKGLLKDNLDKFINYKSVNNGQKIWVYYLT